LDRCESNRAPGPADLSALEQQLITRREALRELLKTTENLVGFEPVKYFVGRDRG
jgi:hypothetical protein